MFTSKTPWRSLQQLDETLLVFTSIDLRAVFSHRVSSKTIIYLNTEWVIGLSVENKENKRSGLFEKTYFRFLQIFENLVDNSWLN